jgi:NAD+ synthase
MRRDQLESALQISPGQVTGKLEQELKDALVRMNRNRMVLGLSGGLDSAVVAWLCRRVMEGDQITALIMPDKESNKKNTADAVAIARQLGIRYRVIELDTYLESARVRFPVPFIGNRLKARLVRFFYSRLKQKTGETPFQTILKGGSEYIYSSYLNKGTANYRFKHRLRLTFLYQAAEETNAMVVGCANRTEALTGFFVKFGIDHNADIMPLLPLFKTQVFDMARWLELPGYLISKPPSPDMIPGITDEYAFELSYSELDMLLYALLYSIVPEDDQLAGKIDYVKSLYDRSRHMQEVYVPDLGLDSFASPK